jgi:Lytic transglycolase
MTFLGLAWVVSYMGSFYAPQTFLNSIQHLFANSASTVPAQPSTEVAIATSSTSASTSTSASMSALLNQESGSLASGSLMRWLPRPERTRLVRIAASPLAITVVQTPQAAPGNAANRPKATAQTGNGNRSPLKIFKQCIPSSQVTAQARPRSGGFQVRIRGQAVAELPTQAGAAKLARRFREVLEAPGFDPLTLQLTRVNGVSAGKAGQRSLLFTIDSALEAALGRNGDLVATDWINNLRVVLGVAPLPLVQAQTQLDALSTTGRTLSGTASWYGPYFHNRLTAAGERFDQYDLTAAHPTLPFDTYLKVTNQKSGSSVIVRINDRGPYVGTRSLDLSRQAARCIGSETAGVVPYSAVIMRPNEAEALVLQPSLQPSFETVKLTSSPASSPQTLARVEPRQN